ncbi:hypothetical protein TNCV_3869451 [Trichonephila clavipes]|nr:hypothetical protein TNCV_3869451 [Trichonephila clavipes]
MKEGSFWVPSVPNEMRVLNQSRQNDRLRVMLRYERILQITKVSNSKAEFTPRLSASSIKRLANQRLHLGRNEVSDWLDARHSTFVRLGVNEPLD